MIVWAIGAGKYGDREAAYPDAQPKTILNHAGLGNSIHRFFEPAKLNIEIKDRLGNPIIQRDCSPVPLFVINQAVRKIKNSSSVDFFYDTKVGKIEEGW